jgi:adenylate kinase
MTTDQEVLLDRITTRACQAKQGGSVARTDDNHEALKVRLDTYNEQTTSVLITIAREGFLEPSTACSPSMR